MRALKGFPKVSGSVDEVIRRVVAHVGPSREDGAVQTLRGRMGFHRTPGVSLAVVEGGRVAWRKAYGRRHRDREDRVAVGTPFQAGSISKAVFAVVVMRLVEQGVVDLDADVNDALRAWRVPAVGKWRPRITLRQILSHTAGLTVPSMPGYRHDEKLPTRRQMLDGLPPANTRSIRVKRLPGTHWAYSGGGFVIAQTLVEDVTGEPLPALAKQLLFEPLGMADSTYDQPLTRAWLRRAATGHATGGTPIPGGSHVYVEQATAGLWTTPTDLARLMIDLQDAWRGTPGTVVAHASARAMFMPQDGDKMGIGFFLNLGSPTVSFEHGGHNEGFLAIFEAIDTERGVVVMANSSHSVSFNTGFLPGELLESVRREYGWPDHGAPTGDDRRGRPIPLETLAGMYVGDGLEVRVAVQGKGLRVALDGQSALTFRPTGLNVFQAREINAKITFARRGRGTRLTIDPGGRTAKRLGRSR